MSDKLKMIIRNSENKHSRGRLYQGKEEFSLPFLTSANPRPQEADPSQRLRRLQGNLRMLERQYRTNLKSGFDNKIKAYRLEAVVQRKLLKQALTSVQKSKEKQYIKDKRRTSENTTLDNSRIDVMKMDRQRRQVYKKQRMKAQKRQFSLNLHQRMAETLEVARRSHDKVLDESQNKNIKRDYYKFLREEETKKIQTQLKQSLLHKIVSNTEKLRQLKDQLQTLKDTEIKIERTFLTI